MSQMIVVTIDENGSIVSTTQGFVGGQCLKAQQALKDGLKQAGIEANLQERTLTAEAMACERARVKVSQ